MTIGTVTKTAQITKIKKRDRPNPHERITHVGGGTGKPWLITQEAAIAHIESGAWEFWVARRNLPSVWVVVGVSRFGNKYLKTEADGDGENNLLSLPEA